VSRKQTLSLKQWLKVGSIAFGVSCIWTLPFTRTLSQSALIGLATVPGIMAGMIVRSRHHQQRQRQLECGQLRLQQLQHRGAILNEQLQSRHQDRQEIELRIAQLHDLAANLTDRFDRDTDRHQQLDRQLATLTLYCQTQENLATDLDRKIQQRQACLLEIDTNLKRLTLELAQVESALIDRQKTPADIQDPLSDKLLQRELKIAELELSSRQAELDNLEFKLQSRLQLINEIDLETAVQSIDPQPPIISRQIESAIAEEWYDKFIDNPHLTVLKHIEKHGKITEAEASSKLGNARSVRQFANKLEEYTQNLPFSIRVESSPKGNRYLREDRN
jgi:chromosome segregation ATPase